MIPRVGESVRPDRRYTTRHGAYAVLVRGDDVLLTHQSAPVPEFQLPGGGIDPGESALQALHREVREETGWTIAPLCRLGAFRRFTYMPEYRLWAEKICAVYLARAVRRIGPPAEPDHTAVWTPAALAPSLVANDGDRRFLAQLASGAPGSRPR
ncbi:NUDIX hydrolase [Ovoidimarina sediminis]|uniref:NUDIX hydrolase n=1 Tax=Ovoidimarina sediminis TaxID=3079856 RepID=UPI002912A726|nr:NUDIX hydrolase [Rhodophyticola sp. MJ-SS7]MDU8944535.1 NUDIX hydrolase [Rhodophyticola sp. MJ-SS7]